MKTKIFNSRLKVLYIAFSFALLSISTAFAATWGVSWGSSSESVCGSINCQQWHNDGYTHNQYPDGTAFATFNGYKDSVTNNGRPYKEMQFVYIDPFQTNIAGSLKDNIVPIWNSASNYNFANGDYYKINFTGSETKKVGVWMYMHNNGEADLYAAVSPYISLSGWQNSTPQTTYYPISNISGGSSTKPATVWAKVKLDGNKPFTLTPTRGMYSSPDFGRRNFTEAQLKQLTKQTSQLGIQMSNRGIGAGSFASSDLHYTILYVEFEAVPEEEELPKDCAMFKTDPGKAGVSFAEINQNTPVRIDTLIDTNGDPYRLSNGNLPTIRYCYTNNNITYSPSQYTRTDNPRCAEAPSNVQMSFRATATGMLTIAVVGSESVCYDLIKTMEVKEDVECEDLTTRPGGGEVVTLEANEPVTVDVTALVDSDGGDYFDPSPVFEYCYSGDIYWNNSQNTYVPSSNAGCVRTAQRYMQNVLPSEPGEMTIKVVGWENVCNDRFTITQTAIGKCENLRINQNAFEENRSNYSVTVSLKPAETPYTVRWQVVRNGVTVLSVVTQGNTIDLAEHGYIFRPGDTLTAQALISNVAIAECYDQRTTEKKDCKLFNLKRENFVRADQRICFTTDWPYFNQVEYRTSDGETGTLKIIEGNCFVLTGSITLNADWIDIWVPDYENICIDRLIYQEEPPFFDKFIKARGDSIYRTEKTVATFMDEELEYKIDYEHYNTGVQKVTITDTIGQGPILGYIEQGPGLPPIYTGGKIEYKEDTMRILVAGRTINNCGMTDLDSTVDLCFEGDIGNPSGVTLYNLPDRQRVVITYKALLDSSVTPGACSDPDSIFNVTGVCGEKYKNTARFRDDTATGENSTELWIPCPFIIIRAGGDVVFENPLDYGIDTLFCADIANVDVPIIVPEEESPETPRTGPDETVIPKYSGDICKDPNAPGYADLTGISSLICEISFKTTQDLTQKAIVQSINTNKQKIARFDKNLNSVQIITNENLLPDSRTNVYYKKDDGDLTFGAGRMPVVFSEGAKTFIVEDGDVYIKNNITYSDTEAADPRLMPSIAIIVINGSIIIDENVTETSGVFFVQEGSRAGSGQLCAGPSCDEPASYSTNQLIHYGSIYGDIEHLFKHRVFAGDPAREEGALVIRFDSRVYINTPPVLNQLVQLTQELIS